MPGWVVSVWHGDPELQVCFTHQLSVGPLLCAVPGDHDLNSRQCKHDGCRKQPVFGDASDGRMVYCKLHKKPHHVDVRKREQRKPPAKSVVTDRQGVAADPKRAIVGFGGPGVDPDALHEGSTMDDIGTVFEPAASTSTSYQGSDEGSALA